jgi:hypothetical protein
MFIVHGEAYFVAASVTTKIKRPTTNTVKAEASKESNDRQWSASTLLLTSEAVFIVSAEEDAQVGGIEITTNRKT